MKQDGSPVKRASTYVLRDEITAIVWRNNWADLAAFADFNLWEMRASGSTNGGLYFSDRDKHSHRADVGDYILRTHNGHYFSMPKEEFEALFKPNVTMTVSRR